MTLEQKKKQIAERLSAMKHKPSEREKFVKEHNDPWHGREKSNAYASWKDRHDRRHGGKSKFDHSVSKRRETERMYSKDS